MKNLIVLALLAMVAASVSACNTIAGAGQDLRDLGHAISSGFNG